MKEARAVVLMNPDVHAYNDFSEPEAVRPASAKVVVSDGRIVHQFPPASVTALYLTL